MTNNIIHWVKPLASLKLTVFCFACAMILVFLGTLDQVNIGVYEAENRYFKSFFLYFAPPGTTLKIPWFPSGYLVGGLLLVNLIAAHLSLSVMNHHGTYAVGKVEPASRWLLDVLMMPRRADAAKVFEVTNPDILDLFGRQEADGKPVSYSYKDCKPFLGEIGKQAGLAAQTEAQTRNAFQRGIIKLRDALRIYLLLKNSIQAEDSPDFAIMYGIICFATLFSFVGTILGGIWADQSWGRFLGWDPKENGALLIVLWNAIILHSRWGGFIRERGLAVSFETVCFESFILNRLLSRRAASV
jgi:hypothetical protein